jgi:hypothetical protein
MNELEQHLVGELPLVEASAFFIGVKHHGWPDSCDETFLKCASVKKSQAQQTIDDLIAGRMPEGKAGHYKFAAEKTDADLKEEGRKRAITSIAAESYREKHRRGERFGEAAGRAIGSVGGAIAGHKLIRHPAGAVAGLAAGYGTGGRIGKELGTEHDIKKAASFEATPEQAEQAMKDRVARQEIDDKRRAESLGTSDGAVKTAARVRMAMIKQAIDEMMGQQESIPAQPAPEPLPVPGGPPTMAQAPGNPPPSALQSINYMNAEMAAQKAQEDNESAFYRERLGKAIAENQMLQQTAQQMQQVLANLQEQTAASGQQMESVNQQAVEAQERALQHSQEAANMRMALQHLREQLLHVASQEPPEVTQQNQIQAQEAANQQMAMAGTPEASPAPGGGAAPGAAPAGAAGEETAPAARGEPTLATTPPAASGERGLKTAGVGESLLHGALGATVGAGVGALGGYQAANRVPAAEERVRRLEAAQKEGFTAAVELAKAKLELARAERDQAQPKKTMLRETARGALAGSILVPTLASQVRQLHSKLRPVA